MARKRVCKITLQVQRKLNVGINTVVDFLRKKGFDVEDNPNTRISDEQYALLVKEFGKDLPEKDRVIPVSRPKKETPSAKEEKAEEIKTEVPDEFKPKIVMKGHIDLEGNRNKRQQEEPKVEPVKPVQAEQPKVEPVQPKKEEVVEQPVMHFPSLRMTL